MEAFLHLQFSYTQADQDGILPILDQILNTPQVLNLWYIFWFEGVYWMGQSRRSWGPFLHLQAVVVGGPWASHEMHARQFHLGDGASWCSGQPSPSNFSLKLKLNACRILDGAALASIFACASPKPLGPKTQNQETSFMLPIIAVFHKYISYCLEARIARIGIRIYV